LDAQAVFSHFFRGGFVGFGGCVVIRRRGDVAFSGRHRDPLQRVRACLERQEPVESKLGAGQGGAPLSPLTRAGAS
jgi:hypothetical protein